MSRDKTLTPRREWRGILPNRCGGGERRRSRGWERWFCHWGKGYDPRLVRTFLKRVSSTVVCKMSGEEERHYIVKGCGRYMIRVLDVVE